ncbi:hypothetical protein DICSQDRAFT_173927 [Dichomitus squalens LYAD-421 SS1]|uniref:Uncharacterized protein n=1 Tax=Dichomitus squalens (strain LYAD-421) TaxID=732165 RepID=R7SMW1_DICSQ|nr:uncharacterized protein DICSQDRAFT_173927 [Dichomitus squalens LYAD-421 SS1]EJF57471.1 hypothetical protein DICSQDRAFT_173927 [Dichomitus squalens LYAD-421 SS1]
MGCGGDAPRSLHDAALAQKQEDASKGPRRFGLPDQQRHLDHLHLWHGPSSCAPSPSLVHFTSDDQLTPVVNSHNIDAQGQRNLEGEVFVLEMYAAWRDWAAIGSS